MTKVKAVHEEKKSVQFLKVKGTTRLRENERAKRGESGEIGR